MKGNKRANDMHAEVKLMFCDHQDLVDEFAYLLPASTGSALVQHHQDSQMHVSEPAGILTSVKDLQKEDMGKGRQYITSKDCEEASDAAVDQDSYRRNLTISSDEQRQMDPPHIDPSKNISGNIPQHLVFLESKNKYWRRCISTNNEMHQCLQ